MRRYVNTLALVVGLVMPNLTYAESLTSLENSVCHEHEKNEHEKTLYSSVKATFPSAVRTGLFVEGVLFSTFALMGIVTPQFVLVKTGAAFVGYGVRYACKRYADADVRVWVYGLGEVSLKNVACGALGGSLKYALGGWSLDPLVLASGALNNAQYELLGSLFSSDPLKNFAVSSAIEVPESVWKGAVKAQRAGKASAYEADAKEGALGSLIVTMSLHTFDSAYGPAVEKAVAGAWDAAEKAISSDEQAEGEDL